MSTWCKLSAMVEHGHSSAGGCFALSRALCVWVENNVVYIILNKRGVIFMHMCWITTLSTYSSFIGRHGYCPLLNLSSSCVLQLLRVLINVLVQIPAVLRSHLKASTIGYVSEHVSETIFLGHLKLQNSNYDPPRFFRLTVRCQGFSSFRN